MERIVTTEVEEHIGERIRLQGWLHNLRRLGGIAFAVLRDGWGEVQIVVESEALATLDGAEAKLESLVEVVGRPRREAQAPNGIEIGEATFRVIEAIREPLPVSIHKATLTASLPTLLDHAVTANRQPARRAIFRLAAGVMAAFRTTLNQHGFTEIQTPKLVASATEGGANVFALDYFGGTAYLAQSPQFYKQIMVGLFERVYEVGPVFRAEPHDTTRHSNEYVSLDVEMGFIDDHTTVMALLCELLHAIFAHLAAQFSRELALLAVDLPTVPAQIPQLHFAEAQQLILARHGVSLRGEPDLSPQDERWLGAWAQEEYGSDFLFVTGYPMVKRPFYTHPQPSDPRYSNSFDLLFRGTEMVTGGQRLHRYPDYLAALAAAGLPTAPFESYLEAFRYGMPPHGGFAIGLERLLMQLTGASNLRLVTLFPRDQSRLSP